MKTEQKQKHTFLDQQLEATASHSSHITPLNNNNANPSQV
jgi:hypothetical protein